MAQQTAMQTLWAWVDANCHEDGFNINDAREMSLKLEKEQIMDAYWNGTIDIDKKDAFIEAEFFYKETYKK
jgi:hypothetical protein